MCYIFVLVLFSPLARASECGRMYVIIKFQFQHAISIKRIPINLSMSPASIIVLIDLLSVQLSTYYHVCSLLTLENTVCAHSTRYNTSAYTHIHLYTLLRLISWKLHSWNDWTMQSLTLLLNLYCNDSHSRQLFSLFQALYLYSFLFPVFLFCHYY